MSSPLTIEYISECFIGPKHTPQESTKPLYLSAWDLALVGPHYNQKGLLFAKPSSFSSDEKQMQEFLEKLKDSLALALIHFYPLAGRLATLKQDDPHVYSIYVDCANGPGAKFIHASLNLTVSDILSSTYVPKIVYSFFDHVLAANYDGHTLPLMTVQVTELVDGIFIGLSINHMLVDGTSFWHFISSWSEIFNAYTCSCREEEEDQDRFAAASLSRPPSHKRWFPEEQGPIISLPFSHSGEFVPRFQVPELKERVFHFSAESLQKLKAKANAECNSSIKISTFQALSAHLWRCITKARKIQPDQTSSFAFSIDNRSRITPPLSKEYFGNCIQGLASTVSGGELEKNGLGWAAGKLHELVVNHTDKAAREWAESWSKQPSFAALPKCSERIQVGSSPRFNIYGNEFGLGKALAVRSGIANKFDGKIMLFPAREGGGNMDVEICLFPRVMACLESDNEFKETVSSTTSPVINV